MAISWLLRHKFSVIISLALVLMIAAVAVDPREILVLPGRREPRGRRDPKGRRGLRGRREPREGRLQRRRLQQPQPCPLK